VNRFLRIAGTAVVVTAIGVGLLGVVVHAQEATPQTPVTAVSNYIEQVWNAVATKLGVKRTELDQAVKDAGAEVAAQALKDGKLTQEQADKLKGSFEAGPGAGWMGHRGGRGGGMMGPGGCAGDQAAIAKALGMTTDELTAALKAGKTVEQLATEKGVDLDAARKTAMKEQLQQAVKDGKMTQAEADWMIQGMDQGFMPGGRGMGHRGGFGGMWDKDARPNPSNPTNPTTPDGSASPTAPNQQISPSASSGENNA
jgi:hypothetical protein